MHDIDRALATIDMSIKVGDTITLNRDHCIKQGHHIPRGYSHATYLIKNTVCTVFWAGEEKTDKRGRITQRIGVEPVGSCRAARVFITVTDESVEVE